jgi:hypothetical protein
MKKSKSLGPISNDDVSENGGRRGRQDEGRGYFLILIPASRVKSEGREILFMEIVGSRWRILEEMNNGTILTHILKVKFWIANVEMSAVLG